VILFKSFVIAVFLEKLLLSLTMITSFADEFFDALEVDEIWNEDLQFEDALEETEQSVEEKYEKVAIVLSASHSLCGFSYLYIKVMCGASYDTINLSKFEVFLLSKNMVEKRIKTIKIPAPHKKRKNNVC